MRRTRSGPCGGVVTTALVALAVLVSGCSGAPMPTPSVSPSASTPPAPAGPFGDGELRVGTLVPISVDASLALAHVAGVELAIREINEAGGVNGVPVLSFHRDSGDASDDALEASFAELLEHGVDVVVGPPTVDLARRLAPLASEAGVMVISPAIGDPAAGSIDADGLFASTLPSAVHDGAGIAAQLPPRARVALVYFSDTTGKGVRDSLADATQATDQALVVTVALTPSMRNPDRVITELRDVDADTIVYAGSPERATQNAVMLTALAEARLAPSLWLTSPLATRHGAPPGVLEGALTVTAAAQPDPAFAAKLRAAEPRARSLTTAAEAYDAVLLAALAATVAGDEGGRAIARTIADVSADGIPCRSYAHCLHVLDTSEAWGSDIDYEGRSGPIDFGPALTAQPNGVSVRILDADNRTQPTP